MKKTLFLSAILGAALCSSAFAAEYTITKNNSTTEIKFDNDSKHMSESQAGDTVTLNVTRTSGNGSFFEDGNAGDEKHIQANIVIENLNINNGYSRRDGGITYWFSGDISGTGEFYRGANQHSNFFRFTGDMSKYTGAVTFDTKVNDGDPNALIFDASSRETGMTVGASSITMQGGTKLETRGNVTFTQANISVANLAISSGKMTIGSQASLNFTGIDGWTKGEETARTSGNGFGTVEVSKDFGTSLESEGTITVGGTAATFNNGVVTGTGTSTIYYVNEGVNIQSLPGATKLIVNSTDGGVNQLGLSNTTYGNLDIVINGGRVITAHNNGTGFTTGDVTVNGGGTLAIVESGQDALGWNDSATKSISLLGESADKKATLELSYAGTGSVTMTTALNLGGHSQVTGTRSFNTFGGVITVDGEDNTISAGLVLRKDAEINVKEGAELLISGSVTASTESAAGSTYTMNKTGDGVLTISGDISGSSNGHRTIINGDGANTIITSASISNATLNNVTFGEGAHSMSNVSFTSESVVNLTMESVTLNAGNIIELGDNHSGKLVTNALVVNGDATINGDLVIATGSTLTFNGGVVTLGCTVEFGEGTTIALGTAYYDELEANGKALIFTGVDAVNGLINGLENVVVTGDFVPGKLIAVQQTDGSYNIYATPEPATATLSLLALAGLMARRRRH